MPPPPTQRLLLSWSTSRLYTATSSLLHAFDASTGTHLASWSAPGNTAADAKPRAPQPDPDAQPGTGAKSQADDGPAAKKRKVETNGGAARTRTTNPILKLLCTSDGKHVLVATAADKTVRVFETLARSGRANELREISARTLPKRIVDLALTDRDTTILCADKFGDVWALPLIDTHPPTEAEKALQEDRRKRTEIDYALPFTHKLLLGHVSMLLALTAVTLRPSAEGAKERTFVITADRDEHVRVTRYPQSHVIHGFCLGHEAFVSALLVPSWCPQRLISAGGDAFLAVWDWRQSRLVQKLDLAEHVAAVRGTWSSAGAAPAKTAEDAQSNEEKAVAAQLESERKQYSAEDEAEEEEGEAGQFRISVTGLHEIPQLRFFLVTVEAVPALFFFSRSPNSSKTWCFRSTLRLAGNVLDVAVDPGDSSLYVTLDRDVTLDHSYGGNIRKYVFSDSNLGKWRQDLVWDRHAGDTVCDAVGQVDVGEEELERVRSEMLYAVGSLRKGFRGQREED